MHPLLGRQQPVLAVAGHFDLLGLSSAPPALVDTTTRPGICCLNSPLIFPEIDFLETRGHRYALKETNAGLAESEGKYRSLYNQRFNEISERMTPEKAEAMGIRGFLMKPVDIAALAEMIRNELDGSEGKD